MSQEFPYGPAFKAAMGRVTAFPDGSEAVMIDSAIALEAFKLEEMVKIDIFQFCFVSNDTGYRIKIYTF